MSLVQEINEALKAKGEWLGKVPLELINGISPYNARKHRIEENIEELENSIGLTGRISLPIVLNQNLQVVCGQRRYIVAKRWNFKEVPVIVRQYNDKYTELADSFNENELTYPLPTEDLEDTIYTLAKAWGEEKTSEVLGISIARISNIVRYREAPEEVQQVLEGEPARVKSKWIKPFKEILAKEGPEALLKKGPEIISLPDHDQDQLIKDYRAGEPIDLYRRKKAARSEQEYELFTIRIHKEISSFLSKASKKMNKDKQELINEILRTWMEEHKGLVKL